MQTETGMKVAGGKSPVPGVIAFVLSIYSLFSIAMLTLTSLMPDFNPPGWLRIGAMAPLPLTLLISLILGSIALKIKTGRAWALSGVIASILVIVWFVVLLNLAG